MKFKVLITLLLFSTAVMAQSGRKAEQKNSLKAAKEHMKYEEYHQALPYVSELVKQDPSSAYYNFWMGKCLYIAYKKNQALPYFEKVEKINPDVDREFHYWYGLTLHYNLHFDRAVAEYRKDLERYQPGSTDHIWVNNRISQCLYAKKTAQGKAAEQVKIANMGEKINSEYSEHSPVISANDTVLLYTARRPECLGADPEANFFDEDIYISYNRNGEWTEGVNIGKPVNAPGHDATISLSADAKKLYLYRHKKAGGLYFTKFNEENQKWNEPVAVSKPLNSKYYEASICQSADSSIMFFTSDRPGGYGGRDIYMTRKTGKNSWTDPENLGSTINTAFDEDAPYFHPDGKTLYYSSNGPNSIGGFDIFVTEMDTNRVWLEPLNMGAPVNTPDDDIYFVLSESGKNGYYTSGMEGGFGEKDIYHISFPYYPYPRRYFVVELAGLVQDVQTLDTLRALVKLVDVNTNEVLDSVYTGTDSSRYYFILEPERTYSLSVSSDGYFPAEAKLRTPALTDEDIKMVKDMFLDKPKEVVQVEKVEIDFQNIYYDFDKDFIREDAIVELERLASFLTKNPEMNVEILSHTDWFGTYDYNVNLSLRRAKNAKNYLVTKLGISPSRITYSHFSENKPLDTNEDDQGRQYNRRSEFRIYNRDEVVVASKKLRNGVLGVTVDHTKPKGQPGFDLPETVVLPDNTGHPVNYASTVPASPENDAVSPKAVDLPVARPETPEEAFTKTVKTAVNGLNLKHIYFDFDKSDLRALSKEQLTKVKDILMQYPDLKLEVFGHTDAFGSTTYNQALSEKRAYAALSYLKDAGAPLSQVDLVGSSELKPIDTNETGTGRQNNRRVEFRILYKGELLVESTP